MGACSYKASINKENRENKSGLYSIFIRVTLDRKSIYFRLDYKIQETYWLGKEGKWIRDSHPLSFEINSLIRSKINSLQEFEVKQRLASNPVTLEKLKKAFSTKGNMGSVIDYFRNWIANLKGKSDGTKKNLRVVCNNIELFDKAILFNQLQESYLQKLAEYLRYDRNLSSYTVTRAIKTFRRVIRQAVKDGYISSDIFLSTKIDIKESEKTRIYLDEQEITKFKNAPIPDNRKDLQNARDQWLFTFYAAFYYKDLKNLEWSDVKESEYGIYIQNTRTKNGNNYMTPIYKFPNAISILDKQRGKHPSIVFPNTISSQKFNDKLKEIVKLAGIDKPLNNRAARHSGIQFYISSGLESSFVGKIVGHKKESTTKIYYDLNPREVNERVKKVDFSNLDI